MEIELIDSEGFGLSALVEADGVRFVVVDRLSSVEETLEPGRIRDVRFDVELVEPDSWGDAFASNADSRKGLEHVRGWRYLGYGEVSRLDPAEIDFGPLRVTLPGGLGPESRLGRHLAVEIDRIIASRREPAR